MVGSVIVSIRPIFAARIYRREKIFELRKTRPSVLAPRIFLLETNGSQTITGLILIKDIISTTPDKLWRIVGERGTTRERFFRYFEGVRVANALEIHEAIKFRNPITMSELKAVDPSFTVPQAYYNVAADSPLHSLLIDRAFQSSLGSGGPISMQRLRNSNIPRFQKLSGELGTHYGQINKDFVNSIVRIQHPGFSTMARLVYEIYSERKLIGFTTITYKLGNCIKTGPTFLFRGYRDRGFGMRLRRIIDRLVEKVGVRKVYCTCPAANHGATSYLLGSGYAVETTLSGQYKEASNELILSKTLIGNQLYSSDVPSSVLRRSNNGGVPKAVEIVVAFG